MFRILARGPFDQSAVTAQVESTSRPTDAELERRIDEIWQERQLWARNSSRILFDGPMLRLVSFVEHWCGPQNGLTLYLSSTSYREFAGTNLFGDEARARWPKSHLANPLAVSGIVVTADEKIVLGLRSDKVAFYPAYVHTFGGAIEPGDVQGGKTLFDALRRELEEELALDPAAQSRITCLGLAEDRTLLQPELLFSVHTLLDERSLRERANSASSADEHQDLITIGALDSIDQESSVGTRRTEREHMKKHPPGSTRTESPPWTPIALAAISLLASFEH